MVDVAKVKRNLIKMRDAGVPEEEMDQYLVEEGVTLEQLQAPVVPGMDAEDEIQGPTRPTVIEEMLQNSQGKDWKKFYVDPFLDPVGTVSGIKNTLNAGFEMLPGVSSLTDKLLSRSDEKKDEVEQYKEGVRALGTHWADWVRDPKKNIRKGIPSAIADASIFAPIGGAGIAAKLRTPAVRAKGLVDKVLKKNPGAEARLDAMGEGAIVADAFPEGGKFIKDITKLDPQSKGIMDDAVKGRQLDREPLIEKRIVEDNDSSQLARFDAYEKVAKDGYGLPLHRVNKSGGGYDEVPLGLEDLFENPKIQSAYKEAEATVQTFTAAKGSTGGPMANLDVMQRILKDKANAARKDIRATDGGNTTAGMYDAAAARVQSYMDDVLGTDVYKDARALVDEGKTRQDSMKRQHDIDTKIMKNTENAINKTNAYTNPPEMGSLASYFSGGAAATGIGDILTGNPIRGAGILGVSAIAPIRTALKSRKFKKMMEVAPEVARIMALPKIPKATKITLIDKILKSKVLYTPAPITTIDKNGGRRK